MEKIVLCVILPMFLLLTGCGQKEYPVNEVFTQDSAFGVNANTTLEELKKKVEMKEKIPNVYFSESALKPYKSFNGYGYRVKNGKICSVSGRLLLNSKESLEINETLAKLKKDMSVIYKNSETVTHHQKKPDVDIYKIYGMEHIDNIKMYIAPYKDNLILWVNVDFERRSSSPDGCPM